MIRSYSRSDNNGGLATNVWADLLKRHHPSLPRLLQEPQAEEGVPREKSSFILEKVLCALCGWPMCSEECSRRKPHADLECELFRY